MITDKEFTQEGTKAATARSGGPDGIHGDARAGKNPDIAMLLNRIAGIRIKSEGRISRSTALLIDSSSTEAIEIGCRLARLISAALIDRVARLHVLAFDSDAYALKSATGNSAAVAERLKNVGASAQANPGAALSILLKDRVAVEQIVLVIGDARGVPDSLAESYAAYRSGLGLRPTVIIGNVGGSSEFVEQELRKAGAPVIVHRLSSDGNSFAKLIPLLCRPSKLERLMGFIESGAAKSIH